ncbi:MAG: hypothetical protein HFE90_00205 [Firmicutes bacterium]|nr:hypothetical protein [Bacillota bacterium]
MFHRFKLISDYTPEQCRDNLKAAIKGNENSYEPHGLVGNKWFRLKQSEYFKADNYTSVLYTVYGIIKKDENGNARISCCRFESSAEPLKFLVLAVAVFVLLSISSVTHFAERWVHYAQAAIFIPVIVLGADLLRCVMTHKMTGEELPSGLDEFLCETMHANKAEN